MWSVHKGSKNLDRAGQATAADFRILSHDVLTALVEFNLTINNRARAVGRLWVRLGCIPMGDRLTRRQPTRIACGGSSRKGPFSTGWAP